MSLFSNSKIVFDLGQVDMELVLADVREYFQTKSYSVETERLGTGGGHVSLTKGGVFRAVLGLKTALNVEIDPRGRNWCIDVSVGIFGQQVIPTIITLFFAWPVLLTQIWGLVQQSKLDDEVISVVESALARHPKSNENNGKGRSDEVFCTQCGMPMAATAKFCPECGQSAITVLS